MQKVAILQTSSKSITKCNQEACQCHFKQRCVELEIYDECDGTMWDRQQS